MWSCSLTWFEVQQNLEQRFLLLTTNLVLKVLQDTMRTCLGSVLRDDWTFSPGPDPDETSSDPHGIDLIGPLYKTCKNFRTRHPDAAQ